MSPGLTTMHACIAMPMYRLMCSGSVVVPAYDSESGRPGSNPEWGLIYYEAPITAQGIPEPSSLRVSTFGIRAAEHKGCNWACKLTDGCSLKSCVLPNLLAYATEKSQLKCMQRLCEWVKGHSISVSYIYIYLCSDVMWSVLQSYKHGIQRV